MDATKALESSLDHKAWSFSNFQKEKKFMLQTVIEMLILAYALSFSEQLSQTCTIVYHHFTDQETEVTPLASDQG